MTDDLARHLVRASFRASRELQAVMTLLKGQLSDTEYQEYAVAIAGAVYNVNEALVEKPLTDRPALRAEIEEHLARYERYL